MKIMAVLLMMALFGVMIPCDLYATESSSVDVSAVNPQPNIISFKQAYSALYLALLIYKLDAIKEYPKDAVKEKFLKDYSDLNLGISGVRFDLESIDIGKAGGTRYYQFSIGDRSFIVRIFRTQERSLQPKVPVLFEDKIEDPDITFQILPRLDIASLPSKASRNP